MGKGQIIKSGKWFQIEYEKKGKKKTISIPPHFLILDEYEGKTVDFDNTGGPVKGILIDGVEIKLKQKNKNNSPESRSRDRYHQSNGRNSHRNQHPTKPSTGYSGAPYNFIPLSEIVVKAEEETNHATYNPKMLSGYLDYDIKTLSPLYIRGEKSEFFGPNEQKIIAGSTMRGMIRSLIEIITYSKLEFTNQEKLLYYRDVAKGKDNYGYRIKDKQKAGWVRLRNRKIELCAAKNIDGNSNFIKIKGEWNGDKWSYRQSLGYKIGSQTKMEISISRDRRGDENIKINAENGQEAVLYITGKFSNKKKRQYILGMPSEMDIKDITKCYHVYSEDDNREISYDLVQRFDNKIYNGEWLPIFYIEEIKNNEKGEEELHHIIGDTLMFRLPYLKKIKDFIPDIHHHQDQEENLTDITNAIFGNLKCASKVYFEDAKMVCGVSSKILERLDVLNSPKPTTYQHYLYQDGDKKVTYNSDNARINGYKMYWHRIGAPYKADVEKLQKTPKLFSDPIRKVEMNSVFQGRIRFDNFTEVELGALIMAIDLPHGCGHRLGLGKPYGLGSVRMENVKISFIDRVKRYKSLFNKGAWQTGGSSEFDSEEGHKSYKIAFINYLHKCGQLKFNSIDDFWSDPIRMSHLKTMLKYEEPNNEWIEKTRYMEIEKTMRNEDGTPLLFNNKEYKDNEYKDRPILRLPNDYKHS